MNLAILRCPTCKGHLTAPTPEAITCDEPHCGRAFPIYGGRPVLIDETRSVFSHASYVGTAPSAHTQTAFARWLHRLPSPSVNLSAVRSFTTMRTTLLARGGPQIVLIVGGGVMGKGMRALASIPGIELINVDPSPTSAALLHCDGHDLPFADASVDAVVVQAVLEHVADPVRCVAEIHRVLKPNGLVYSETPFMQQVHMQGSDFTRFTHIGHRRLFRGFTEIESGVVAGPGTALAWSWRYFLAAFFPSFLSKVAFAIGRVSGFVFEQFDHLLRQRPAALDGASCTYFLGSRADLTISDRQILDGYRGAL